MTRSTTRQGAAVIVIAVVIGAVAVFSGGSHVATASADFAALQQPASSGLTPAVSQAMATQNTEGMQLAAAKQILTDANGTVWIVPTTSNQVCLIWDPSGTATQVPGHPDITLGVAASCIPSADANAKGIFIGAPGSTYYGVAPAGVTQVQATVNGTPVPLSLTNGGFSVPTNATSVTVGSAPVQDLTHSTKTP